MKGISRFEIESAVTRSVFNSLFSSAFEELLKKLKENPEVEWKGIIMTLRSYDGGEK